MSKYILECYKCGASVERDSKRSKSICLDCRMRKTKASARVSYLKRTLAEAERFLEIEKNKH